MIRFVRRRWRSIAWWSLAPLWVLPLTIACIALVMSQLGQGGRRG